MKMRHHSKKRQEKPTVKGLSNSRNLSFLDWRPPDRTVVVVVVAVVVPLGRSC
jgi:hypothetical protein